MESLIVYFIFFLTISSIVIYKHSGKDLTYLSKKEARIRQFIKVKGVYITKISIMKHIFLLFLIFAFTSLVHSGPIFEEYKKIEADKRLHKNSPEKLKAQLEKTLLGSLKITMLKFFDYPDYEDIGSADFAYESIGEARFTYYVKYKTFLGYFIYANDPSQYFLTPIKVKFTNKPGTKLARRDTIIEEGIDQQKK